MSSSLSTTATRPSRRTSRERRSTALFTTTACLTLGLTGIGLFEHHVVYPSWYDLATFDGFAAYHSAFGRRLIPWLPAPLLVATVLNAMLLRWRPRWAPWGVVATTFVLQICVVVLTVTLALPLQAALSTAGASPDEIVNLLDRLTVVSRLREVPGVAVALAFSWMLWRQMEPRPAAAADGRIRTEPPGVP